VRTVVVAAAIDDIAVVRVAAVEQAQETGRIVIAAAAAAVEQALETGRIVVAAAAGGLLQLEHNS
jgi:hypothetical protein